MITFVLISCGRLDYLRTTISSFMKYNTYPIAEYILIDDSENKKVHDKIRQMYPNFTLLLSPNHKGEVASIDEAYSHVKTDYIFHCEDDWEFTKASFIEPSLEILEHEPMISQVWLLWAHPHITHFTKESYMAGGTEYHLMDLDIGGIGLTWNPGLRRLSDYKLIAPFTQYFQDGDPATTAEWFAARRLTEMGYRSAILKAEYCHHIGKTKA